MQYSLWWFLKIGLCFIHLMTGHFWDHCKENNPSTDFWFIWWTYDSRTVQRDCWEVGRLPDWSRPLNSSSILYIIGILNWCPAFMAVNCFVRENNSVENQDEKARVWWFWSMISTHSMYSWLLFFPFFLCIYEYTASNMNLWKHYTYEIVLIYCYFGF